MNITPLQDYVVLEEVKSELSKQGILISDNVDIEKPNLAVVLKKGKDCTIKCKEGDTVLFKRHLFDEVTLEETLYLLGKDEGIVALIC